MRVDDGTCTCGARDGVDRDVNVPILCSRYVRIRTPHQYLLGRSVQVRHICTGAFQVRIGTVWITMVYYGLCQLFSPSSYFLTSPRCRRCRCRRRLTEPRLDSVPDRTAGGLSRTVCDLGHYSVLSDGLWLFTCSDLVEEGVLCKCSRVLAQAWWC